MSESITIRAANDEHLQGILDLQQRNLPVNLSPEVMKDQGFVTVEHNIDILRSMNHIHRHAIALDGQKVIGYALAMDRSLSDKIPFLISLFNRIESNLINTETQDIDEKYSAQGLFTQLYHNLRERLSDRYSSIYTDVACKNTRSIRAHEKVGFRSIEVFETNGEEWDIIQWNWRESDLT